MLGRTAIAFATAALLLVGCGGDGEIEPEVADRIAELDARTDALALELGHHTATMALAVDDIYTLELQEATYRTTSRHAVAELYRAIADLYACAGNADTDGLDGVTHLATGIWFELNKHRGIVAEMDDLSGLVLEERRHSEEVGRQLEGIRELGVVVEDEATRYSCR